MIRRFAACFKLAYKATIKTAVNLRKLQKPHFSATYITDWIEAKWGDLSAVSV